ncbi:hypothetical protein ACFO3O_01005 [Dokdonia ponticola]|uniref:Uncharacterized protein n=1 Tax=Dokdonia ponticola TaxID=2041041 RepID=A0ABV9HQK6_9FLAO
MGSDIDFFGMNEDEKKAKKFLLYLGYDNIDFEPRGCYTFPDFSIGKIGVEVRRLNHQIEVDGKFVALEDFKESFLNRMRLFLNEFDTGLNHCLIASVAYKRPLKPDNKFYKNLEESIKNTIKHKIFGKSVSIGSNFSYTLYESRDDQDTNIYLGVWSDKDEVGWDVTKKRYQALEIAIREKEKKLLDNLDSISFEKNWLILVDYIFSRVDENTLIDLGQYPKLSSSYDKIFLISRFDSKGIELNYKRLII